MCLVCSLCLNCHYTIRTIQRESLTNWLCLSLWWKKIWQMNRSANRLLIVSTNLDGFSLVNHGQFVKFAKLFRYTVLIMLIHGIIIFLQLLAFRCQNIIFLYSIRQFSSSKLKPTIFCNKCYYNSNYMLFYPPAF